MRRWQLRGHTGSALLRSSRGGVLAGLRLRKEDPMLQDSIPFLMKLCACEDFVESIRQFAAPTSLAKYSAASCRDYRGRSWLDGSVKPTYPRSLSTVELEGWKICCQPCQSHQPSLWRRKIEGSHTCMPRSSAADVQRMAVASCINSLWSEQLHVKKEAMGDEADMVLAFFNILTRPDLLSRFVCVAIVPCPPAAAPAAAAAAAAAAA